MGYNFPVKEQKAFHRHVQKALEFLLKEYDAFKEFKDDLEKLSAFLESAKKEKPQSFKHLLKDFTFSAKTERRFNRFLFRVERDLKKMISREKSRRAKKELEELEQHLEIGGKFILAAAALHQGRIRQELKYMEFATLNYSSINVLKDLQQSYIWHLEELKELVDKVLSWIAALTDDLERAKQISLELTEGIGPHRMRFVPADDNISLSIKTCFHVTVVDFSKIPTGTHKFLKATYTLKKAGGNVLGAITAGNYGLALKALHQAHYPEKELHLFLDRNVDPRILQGLKGRNVFVHAVDLNAGWFGRKEMENIVGKTVEDITNISDSEIPLAYKSIHKPVEGTYTAIFCPVGSGELLAAFREHGYERMMGVKIYGVVPYNHPFVRGNVGFSPMPKSIADSLVTPWISPKVVQKLLAKDVQPLAVQEEDFATAYRAARSAGYDVEISGAAGFVAVLPKYIQQLGLRTDCDYWQKSIDSGKPTTELFDNIIIIATGNGHKYFGIE